MSQVWSQKYTTFESVLILSEKNKLEMISLNFFEMCFCTKNTRNLVRTSIFRTFYLKRKRILYGKSQNIKGDLCFDFICVLEERRFVNSGIAASPYQNEEIFIFGVQIIFETNFKFILNSVISVSSFWKITHWKWKWVAASNFGFK